MVFYLEGLLIWKIYNSLKPNSSMITRNTANEREREREYVTIFRVCNKREL